VSRNHRTTDVQDAFGHALLDALEGRPAAHVIERKDGFIDVAATLSISSYLLPLEQWPAEDREALAEVRGRTLDVGCGGGRFLIPLQERGHDVVGIDVSPLALEVCRRRGGRNLREMSLAEVDDRVGPVDTVLMMGNNFGLFGNPRRARRLLRHFHRLTSPPGRIVAESLDPHRTSDPFHLALHAANRARGRMAGEIRMRVRYKVYCTPWLDLLLVSREEMTGIVSGTGWRIVRVIESAGRTFTAVLEKEE
jgi:SAM-dependent methyltransferase